MFGNRPESTSIRYVEPDVGCFIFEVPARGWRSLLPGLPIFFIPAFIAWQLPWSWQTYDSFIGVTTATCIVLYLFIINYHGAYVSIQGSQAPERILSVTRKTYLRVKTFQWRAKEIKDVRVRFSRNNMAGYWLEIRPVHGWSKSFLYDYARDEIDWIRGTIARELGVRTVDTPVPAVVSSADGGA